jgi:alpha-N-arabinofuranosidase
VRLQISGLKSVAAKGTFTVLSSNDPEAGNSLDTPERIVPKTQVLSGVSRDFVVTLPAYSVSVLDFEAK